MSWIWPLIRSLAAEVAPLYGTCVIRVPVIWLNSSVARWLPLPMPPEP